MTLKKLLGKLPQRSFTLKRRQELSTPATTSPRENELSLMLRASIARCSASWRALGVPHELATQLANDPTIGAYGTELAFTETRRVILLTGDFGSGKSLRCERWLQSMIGDALTSTTAPLPVYLEASEVTGTIQAAIEGKVYDPGLLKQYGACIVLDKADEIAAPKLQKIIEDALALADTWPNTKIIIASRPILAYLSEDSATAVPLLNRKQWRSIMIAIAGRTIEDYEFRSWEKPLRSVLSRPLFAVLAGLWIRRNEQQSPPASTLALLADWINRAIEQTRDRVSDKQIQYLHKLAVRSVDRGGAAIPVDEVCGLGEVNTILETGLVTMNDRRLGFPLPILTQWFAAHSLANGTPPFDSIGDDLERLELWKFTIVLYLSIFDEERVNTMMSLLARRQPAIAAEIIRRSGTLGGTRSTSGISMREIGERMLYAMQAWIDGLGPTAQACAPVRNDGSLRAFGIWKKPPHTDPAHTPVPVFDPTMITSWNAYDDIQDRIVSLSVADTTSRNLESGWRSFRLHRYLPDSALWYWLETLEFLTNRFHETCYEYELPYLPEPMRREQLWDTACAFLDSWGGRSRQIVLSELLEAIERERKKVGRTRLGRYNTSVSGRGHYGDRRRIVYDYDWLADEAARLQAEGVTTLDDPWPMADKADHSSHRTWTDYSRERLAERMRVILLAALESYDDLARHLFPSLRARMKQVAVMPCRLVVFIDVPFYQDGYDVGLSWYAEALPEGMPNEVTVSYDERRMDANRDAWNDMLEFQEVLRRAFEQLRAMRPSMVGWLQSFGTDLIVLRPSERTPVTEIVYRWLQKDLGAIAWLKKEPEHQVDHNDELEDDDDDGEEDGPTDDEELDADHGSDQGNSTILGERDDSTGDTAPDGDTATSQHENTE